MAATSDRPAARDTPARVVLRPAGAAAGGQRPRKVGWRFSRNAITASRVSPVEKYVLRFDWSNSNGGANRAVVTDVKH